MKAAGVLTALAVGNANASGVLFDDALNNAHFEIFVTKYNKNYQDDDERQLRYKIFKENLVKIEKKNAEETDQATYGVNSFSDMTDAEFKANYLGLRIPAKNKNLTMYVPKTDTVLQSMDWVSRGAVTPVKNQGQCGSCWTFSTTGAIEGAWKVATGRLVSLSEQQVVDCASSAGEGCSGGVPSEAIEWEENQGICGENEYRYTARDGSCRSCSSPVLPRGSVTGAQRVGASNSGLMQALGEKPVSVCVDAGGWQNYHGGIFSDCGTSLDHAVLAVGYDSSSWKIKNSWGTDWGESGYIRLRMGNTCGVLNEAYLAVVRGGPTPPSPPGPTPPSPTPCRSCSWFSWCPAGETCQYNSYDSGCCSSGPSPPPPSPPAPPSPPGPSPCHTCEYNGQCPSGQDCYYPSADATSGCCSSSPPGKSTQKQVIV